MSVTLSVGTSEKRAAEEDPRWRAVAARDPKADGSFVYSVRSTGVYCRPSCPARPAKRSNVQFHASPKDAERAGFRPCKRCKPDQPGLAADRAAKVADICRFIETADRLPKLDEVARRAQMSPHHFHRVFKQVTGVTPAAYARAHRAGKVRDELARRDQTVTEAIYGSGFNGSSRFYEAANAMLGMKPSDYRAGGANTTIRFAVGECSLGSILVARTERGVCAILLGDEPETLVRELENRFPRAHLMGGDAEFERFVAKVVGFVEAPSLGLDLPLDVRGTAFQQRVWRALKDVPAGKTVSYSDVAKVIGSPKAVRAVAQACAANPIAVAIPCHRVVRTGGGLSGYRWGIERKRALLKKEKASSGPRSLKLRRAR
jgi:AraC family transcriptional regulator of adaptative response/methylated-DNA-[protein]-cysteine methyltransferase